MGGMDDLVQFLRDRLDEDEQIAAQAVSPDSDCPASPKWDALLESIKRGWEIFTDQRRLVVASVGELDARHIARHDPARVLAEVDAKRRILDEHPPGVGWDGNNLDGPVCRTCSEVGTDGGLHGDPYPCTTVRLLALPHAEEPGYREEWRPPSS